MRHDHAAFVMTRAPQTGACRRHVMTALVAVLVIDVVLLLPFLGVGTPVVAPVALLGAAVIEAVRRLTRDDNARIPWQRLCLCLAIALALTLLGGEGGIFYANKDWQVRDAVLRDLTISPWPFSYALPGGDAVLRAPIAMYLLPALAAKFAGAAAAGPLLLLQNALLVGALLALGSTLFADRKARTIAAAVVIGFSGMDALGALMLQPALLGSFTSHLEPWAGPQFSSTITILFWVPQHGLAGWTGALLFLLWRRRSIPLALFLTPLPLLALWSPFGLAGTLPFAALAMATTVSERRLSFADVVPPLLSTLLALPSLAYLASGSGEVGVHLAWPDARGYGFVEGIEVLPFLLCLRASATSPARQIELATVAAVLLLVPFVSVGLNCDFMMRASIPALTVLAVLSAEEVVAGRPGSTILAVMLAIGAITPLHEMARAVRYRPAPETHCSLIKAFDQSYAEFGIAQYAAPVSAMPPLLRPRTPFRVPPDGARGCWDREWMLPR